MLIQEKQGFSTLDFFTIVFSFGFIVYISAPIVSHHMESEGINKAQKDIVAISQSLLQPAKTHESFLALTKPGTSFGRGIASVDQAETVSSEKNLLATIKKQKDSGTIGLDPWGNPYHYIFVRNASGVQTHVVVWSDGPDRQSQTEVQAQLEQNLNSAFVAFQGDDVGSVIPVR